MKQKMKKLIYIFIVVSLLLCVATLLCIKKIHLVYAYDYPYVHTQVLTKPVEEYHVETFNIETVEDLIDESVVQAGVNLRFSEKNDIENGKANCVGYAEYAANIFNDIAKQKGFSERAIPVVGYYYLGNINMHKLVSRFISEKRTLNFIKDHNYVRVINTSGEVVNSFDPSVWDLTLLSFQEKKIK